MKQFARYFTPIKGYGTLGMYHWFIILSEWVLVISVVTSVILEINNPKHEGWIQFIENYAIGIACSDVIVLATSIAQFISERNKHAKKFYSSANVISYFLYAFKADYESFGKRHSQQFADGLLMHIKQFTSNNHEQLYWFNITKDDMYNQLDGELCSIAVWLDSSPDDIYEMTYNDIKDLIVDTYDFGNLVFPAKHNFLKSICANIQQRANKEIEERQEYEKNDQL